MNEDDIDVKLDNNKGRLTIQGQKVNSTETSRFTSKFYRTFALDPAVDGNKLTATLKDGVLSVSAPKDLTKLEESVRTISISSAAVDDAPSNTEDGKNTGVAHEDASQEEGQKGEEPEDKLSNSDSTAEGHKGESGVENLDASKNTQN